MRRCRVHGEYSGDSCSACLEAEEKAESDRAEILERLDQSREENERARADLAFSINNPGDYCCPHCKLRSLLMEASRCPRCHGEISAAYWYRVRQQLEEKRIRDEKRRILFEEEARVRAESYERERAAQARVEAAEKVRRKWGKFARLYFLYLLPSLTIYSVSIVGPPWGWFTRAPHGFDLAWFLIPLFNWFTVIAGLLVAPVNLDLGRVVFVVWLTVGIVILAQASR